jgi:hypothetical protein
VGAGVVEIGKVKEGHRVHAGGHARIQDKIIVCIVCGGRPWSVGAVRPDLLMESQITDD